MISVGIFVSIQALHQEGLSKKAIARRLGVDPRTVRKWLRRIERGAAQPRRAAVSTKLEPFAGQLEEWVRQDLSATQIYQKLCELEGFEASYPTVRRTVRALRPEPVKAVYRRMDYGPGEEAQVDFGEVGSLVVAGRMRKLYVFAMTLCWSRYAYYELVLEQTVPAFLGAIRRAFEYFGGAPRRLKPDNLKAAVLLDQLGQRYYQDDFLALCRHYGCTPDAARPATPTDKGRIERDIGYAKGNHFRGREPVCFEEEQQALSLWREQVANVRVHRSTGRRPVDMHQEEKQHLRALPPEPYEVCQVGEYKVRKDCHIAVLGNFYSVPYQLVGERVLVKVSEHSVEVFGSGCCIARHERAMGRGQSITDEKHYPPKKRLASQELHHQRLLTLRAVGPACIELLGCLRRGRYVFGEQLARLSSLLERHGAEALELACRRALHFGATESVAAVSRILERQLHRQPLPTAVAPAAQRAGSDYDRPLAEYAALLALACGEVA